MKLFSLTSNLYVNNIGKCISYTLTHSPLRNIWKTGGRCLRAGGD